MADEKTPGNQPNQPPNSGGGNANKGPSKSNRRRSLRSKRRGRKPEEGTGTEAREPRTEAREVREPREARQQPNAAKPPVEKNVRDNRERRRRRRMRAKQRGPSETPSPVVEDILKDLPPLVPAFVYTHVLRPPVRDSFEFRSEHFSKVTRKMEDFYIDLSPLYPEGGDEIKGVAYMPPLADRSVFEDDDEDLEEGENREIAAEVDVEGLDNPDWDAEESGDAARLEGVVAIADDFYEQLDDSVVDEYPEEDIDA
jgi:hypothetical protein